MRDKRHDYAWHVKGTKSHKRIVPRIGGLFIGFSGGGICYIRR